MELWEAIHWHLSSLFKAWLVFCKPAAYQSEKLSQVVLDDGLARLVDQFAFHLIVDDPLTINRLHRWKHYSPVLRWSVSYSLHLSTYETPSSKSTQKEVGTTLLKGTMLKRNRQEEQSMLQLLTKELRSIDLLALLIGVRYQPEIAYTMYSSFSVRLFPGGAGQRHFWRKFSHIQDIYRVIYSYLNDMHNMYWHSEVKPK